MALSIALTGNIGSGKSLVAKVFSILGVPIYYADFEAKKFLTEKSVIDQIISFTNNDIVDINNKIIPEKLANIVFEDKNLLLKLNSLIHPLVISNYKNWLSENKNYSYCIMESAIIFESNLENYFDKIFLVHCPKDIAINRAMKRDNITKETILQRSNNQIESEEKINKADSVIHNYNNFSVLNQVFEIHNKLSHLNI